MANNLLAETLVAYRDVVSDILPAREGRRMHVGTLHRWRSPGLRGVHLESVKIGGRWFTSRQALERFFTQLSLQDQKRAQPQPVGSTTARSSDEALARLREDGF